MSEERTVSAKRARTLRRQGWSLRYVGSTINGKARYARIGGGGVALAEHWNTRAKTSEEGQ